MPKCKIPSLIHLDRMTDSTGMIQHGIYSLPRRESGYTTDDNARALRFCVKLRELRPSERNTSRVANYLSFLEHARSPVRGFHNFLGYQRDWLDVAGTGDCQGQAVLALAQVLQSSLPNGFRSLAYELLKDAIPAVSELRSLRAQAYVIQSCCLIRKSGTNGLERLEAVARLAANRLFDCYHRSMKDDWFWFESSMTYANAVLPHAMFDAAELWPAEGFLDIAESSLGFLNFVTTSGSCFSPIGNRDWYTHGEEKSVYDQQPVEASTMAAAALAAFQLTRKQKYLEIFSRSCEWFHGLNEQNLALVDIADGACFDGLMASGVNQNQGAESTLAYLWTALLQIQAEQDCELITQLSNETADTSELNRRR